MDNETKKWWRRIPGFRSGTKWKMVVAVLVYVVILSQIYSILNTKPAPVATKDTSTPSTESNNSKKTVSATPADTSTLTPTDIQDYENGVFLQATHTLNSAQNGPAMIIKSLSDGDITIDEFHQKSVIANKLTSDMYNLFQQQKSPSQLQPITDKYNNLIRQVIAINSQFETANKSDISSIQNKLKALISQKPKIDQEFTDIKNEVMKAASNQATSAAKSSDSYLKPGPDKIASNGGLGDAFDVIKSAFGDPTRVNQEMNQGVGMYGFQNDKIMVDFVQSRADHVTYQSVDLTMDQAKELAKGMMPPDAKLIKQYAQDNQQFYVYQSQALTPLFDSSWFENKDGEVQPGYFDIAYLIDNGRVTGVDSFISDNP